MRLFDVEPTGSDGGMRAFDAGGIIRSIISTRTNVPCGGAAWVSGLLVRFLP